MSLVLSLFPGIGLLDLAFEEAGYCVVRGPDALWGGDIHRFSPPAGKFSGIIGGPPCQRFSRLAALVRSNGNELAPDLIPEFSRVIEAAQPDWFLMENVPSAPPPGAWGYHLHQQFLNNRWVGGEQDRKRLIVFGTRAGKAYLHVDQVALEALHHRRTVLAAGEHHKGTRLGGYSGTVKQSASRASVARALEGQGLPPDFLKNCPLTVEGQQKVIGNGVPLPMGRALAAAVAQQFPPSKPEAA